MSPDSERWVLILERSEMPIVILVSVHSVARRFMVLNQGCELEDLEAHIDEWMDQQNLTADQWDTTAVSSLLEAIWLDEL